MSLEQDELLKRFCTFCEPLTGSNNLNPGTSIPNDGNVLVREIYVVIPIRRVQENTLILLQSSYVGKPPITGSSVNYEIV